MYDPFERGAFEVVARTEEARDAARGRVFPVEIWSPAGFPPAAPTIVYSHHSGGSRRAASYLCTHLCSHGYTVAALDHSEVVAPELGRGQQGETAEQRAARVEAVIASRVPDVKFLLDYLGAPEVGIVGHSFGGWTALAAVDEEPRIRAVVALAPGGASNPKPGILPLKLNFRWGGRNVPTLYVVAENDSSLPLSGMKELFQRTPGSKRMIVLPKTDHLHFIDDAARQHEAFRTMSVGGDLARIQQEMLPMAQLLPEEEAHRLVRGLTLAHLDGALRGNEQARAFLDKQG